MFSGLTERRRERFVGLYIFIGLRGKVWTLLSMFYELQSSSLRISLPIYQNSLHCESEIKMAWFLSENGFQKCRVYLIFLNVVKIFSSKKCLVLFTHRKNLDNFFFLNVFKNFAAPKSPPTHSTVHSEEDQGGEEQEQNQGARAFPLHRHQAPGLNGLALPSPSGVPAPGPTIAL